MSDELDLRDNNEENVEEDFHPAKLISMPHEPLDELAEDEDGLEHQTHHATALLEHEDEDGEVAFTKYLYNGYDDDETPYDIGENGEPAY